MTKFAIAIAGALLAAGVAQAQTTTDAIPKPDVSTEAMVSLCKNTSDQIGQTFCYGFGEGIYQAALLGNGQQRPTICLPAGGLTSTREQVLAEFLTWVDAQPSLSKDPAAATVMKFLAVRYPCKN